jgi:hypothetical protein
MPLLRITRACFKPPLRARRSLLPVISALRNPALKERHWAAAVAAVEAAGGVRLEMTPGDEAFTLQVRGDVGSGQALLPPAAGWPACASVFNHAVLLANPAAFGVASSVRLQL